MKNVHIYNIVDHKKRYDNDLVHNYLRAQIDNSLRLNWKPSDIVLGLNFDFEYNGIKSIPLQDVCEFNVFCNKWYGMRELVKKGILDDEFWFHDLDSWQINEFEFPFFIGGIAGCTYVFTPEWNTSSVYVSKEGEEVLDIIYNTIIDNQNSQVNSDEEYIVFLRRSKYKDLFSTLSNEFNVGKTKFEFRYNNANLPVYVCGFKSHEEDDCKVFEGYNELKVNLVDTELIKIFKEHNIYYK